MNPSHDDRTARYAPFLRYAHWITFVLVLLAYVFVNLHGFLPRGSPERFLALKGHFLMGMLVLLLTLPRIVARLGRTPPPIRPTPSLPERIAAGTVHIALFLFLVVQPALGITAQMLSGLGIALPGTDWKIPSIGEPQKELAKSILHLHEFVGTAFYYVIALHILAALYHWWIRRDNVMQRML